MSINNRDIPLVFGRDQQPNYNWFGDFDFRWFEKSGNLFSIPFFEATPQELSKLLATASTRQKLRLGFAPVDCTTSAGSRNCTEACLDPAFLFTPANLRACTALASAALLVQNGTYRVDLSESETTEVMVLWGIPELATFKASDMLSQVTECIAESCVISGLECGEDVKGIFQLGVNVDNLNHLSTRLGHYCWGAEMRINPDIAGPGVSYQFCPHIKFLTLRLIMSNSGFAILLLPDMPCRLTFHRLQNLQGMAQ